MQGFLTALHVFVSIFMILVILLQAGKGGGMGMLTGGSQVFGARGAQPFLGKVTTVCAIIFMVTSLSLAYLSSSSRSVLEGVPLAPPPAPSAPAAPGAGGATE